MAIELTMVRMKVAILRHSWKGAQAGLVATGATGGVLLAAGTIYLGGWDADLFGAACAIWMLGWILGPVVAGGGDETLRPEYFTLLGLRPRRLATGLLTAAFIGVAPLISLLALSGLVVAGARLGPAAVLTALPAMVLQVAVFVLLSKVAVAVMGIALRSRVGAVGAGLINGAILAALGQCWVFVMAFGGSGGIPAGLVRALPSGWGLAAVEAAGSGDGMGAAAALARMAALIVVLLVAWAALLTRRTGYAQASARDRRPMRATTREGGVVSKELRTWSRDLLRTHQLTFSLAYGLTFGAAPLVLGWDGMLAWAGPIFVTMATAMSANLYGADGTALWLTLMTPGASDVRGRQLAWLLTVGPVALVLTAVLTALAGASWPLLLATVVALTGGGAGLVPLVSVYALVPGSDPHRRTGNPLRVGEDGAAVGLVYGMLLLSVLTAAPAVLVALWSGWAGVAAGLVTGGLCYWGFGRLAERRLRTHGPELLEIMRTGRRPSGGMSFKMPDLPQPQKTIVTICLTLGAIPLFPQGILAGMFLANGSSVKSWFLALYMPPGLRWPTAVFMMLLGLSMYGAGVWIPLRLRRRLAREAAPAPAPLPGA
ncbi:hypothetical protein [Sphaerisporangium corydalis]|uniref:ABC-2 type transport system permease protein n=1 Tax=Sphaerisporangium corydalis TaxID=1441875 RepID=A0ABV9EQW3_9ACTN|nr:hypothetical protein [Sphaerisporangium corydalis]